MLIGSESSLLDIQNAIPKNIQTVNQALKKIKELLERCPDMVTDDELHAVKSTLYVAIERMGMEMERLGYSQRLMREIFSIVNMKADMKEYERRMGLQILENIEKRIQ